MEERRKEEGRDVERELRGRWQERGGRGERRRDPGQRTERKEAVV